MRSICFEGGYTFDMDDIVHCHVRSGEFVDSGSICKCEKATVVSKEGNIICVMAHLSSSPQASEVRLSIFSCSSTRCPSSWMISISLSGVRIAISHVTVNTSVLGAYRRSQRTCLLTFHQAHAFGNLCSIFSWLLRKCGPSADPLLRLLPNHLCQCLDSVVLKLRSQFGGKR